ncbi:MAG TPA: aminotransferase class V-fold PLP-dependent enzyme [Opitutaceae bacterium]|nr:aminotransferase class V-fold PLP-dependent enzyme [Opitutaceae bacterium]
MDPNRPTAEAVEPQRAFDGPGALPKELFLLDPEIAFLNHGSFGATPRVVFEQYQAWQRELERQPVEFLGRRFAGLMREARSALAAYVHTGADNLVYVPNATTALNIVARGLRLDPGDEILTTDHEYGAIDRMWRFLCRKTGAVYRPVHVPLPVTTAGDLVERLWAAVTPRTRVLFHSHLTSPTALVFPVGELCRRARAAGLLSIVDGAHALGQIPLDLEAIGADFYTANAHKWLCAPKGSAFLYARPGAQAPVEPLVVSWGDQGFALTGSPFLDEQQWTGTRDIAAYLAVPAAIRFCAEHRWEEVRARCHALARHARNVLAALTGLPPICPDSVEWFGQMVTVPLPPCDGPRLQARLYDQYRVEVPVMEWGGRQFLRVSIQAYNTADDVARLVKGLREILGGGPSG